MHENQIGRTLVDAAIQVHRETGPGLLESVYEKILYFELLDRGLAVERQVGIPIVFKGRSFDEGFRADLVVEKKVIVELKCVASLNDAHLKQLLTYLRLSGLKLGFLMNFNENLLKNGIRRTVNNLRD